MGDGNKYVRHLYRVWAVFLMLDDNYYARVNLPFLLHIEYLRQNKEQHELYNLFEGDLSCFNEEAGEISFSILGRCTLGDTVKNKNEHMSDMYLLSNHLLHTKNEVLNEFDEIKQGGESHAKLNRNHVGSTSSGKKSRRRRLFWRT